MNIRHDILDISKYNETLDDMVDELMGEITARETNFRNTHPNVSTANSILQTQNTFRKVIAILAKNLILKSEKLLEEGDKEIIKKTLGLSEEYGKR